MALCYDCDAEVPAEDLKPCTTCEAKGLCSTCRDLETQCIDCALAPVDSIDE